MLSQKKLQQIEKENAQIRENRTKVKVSDYLSYQKVEPKARVNYWEGGSHKRLYLEVKYKGRCGYLDMATGELKGTNIEFTYLLKHVEEKTGMKVC